MMPQFDYVILGGGCIGSSIAAELSRMSLGAVGLVDAKKEVSATSHSAGMLRVFHENERHTELALKNYSLMENLLETQTNGSLYFFDKKRLTSFKKSLDLMEQHNYPFEILSSREGKLKFPAFNWNDRTAIFEKKATSLCPTKLSDTLKNSAQQHGVQLMNDFDVQRISFYKNQYILHGEKYNLVTRNLILAGGARMLPRLKDLGINIELDTRKLTVYSAQAPLDYQDLPNFLDRETMEFGKLNAKGGLYLSSEQLFRVSLPQLELSEQSTFDSYAPDRQGHIGHIPGHEGLYLASGWGGTAFKFSLEIARQMSQIITHHQPLRRAI